MAKLTRKSYKRKKVAFAAVVLGGVALVSSGFAAFVLSANADQKNEGGVEVGILENKALTMQVFKVDASGNKAGEPLANGKLEDYYFSFDADEADIEGNAANKSKTTHENGLISEGLYSNRAFYFNKSGNDHPERLSNTFVIEISSATESLYSFTVKLTTSGTDKDFDTPVTNGFITLPGCSDETGSKITDFATASQTFGSDSCSVAKTGDETKGFPWTFKYTVSFAWGPRFNNMNPCYFFDNKATSATPSTGEKITRTEEAGSGNCYGTSVTELTPGWKVNDRVIGKDWDGLRTKVNGATYNIQFSAQAK